jgi:hypothetical protein
MTGFSLRVNAAVAAAHDFGRYGVIVDVGERADAPTRG